MFLSKSDYMMAQNCVKALWLKKNRKNLTPKIDEATQKRFDIGNEIQDLAREFFPCGVMVPAENWDVINGSKITAELAKAHNVLYEAFAKLDNRAFCRIDVLKRNGDGWDLIEIKSATSVKGEYISDLAFQKCVFDNAGYPIKQCCVLHINPDYMRQGLIDVRQLFQIEDVTEAVAEVYINTPAYAKQYMKIQTSKNEPEILLHKACKDCMCFHFSLHIQSGALEHITFLHKAQSDPRCVLAEKDDYDYWENEPRDSEIIKRFLNGYLPLLPDNSIFCK